MEKGNKPHRTEGKPESLSVKAKAFCPKCKTIWHGDITGAAEVIRADGIRYEKVCARCYWVTDVTPHPQD